MHLSTLRLNFNQLRQTGLWKASGYVLRLLAGLLLLVVSFWQVDLQAVLSLFLTVRVEWLILALLSVVASTILKAIRWIWLSRQFGVLTRWSHILGAYLLGQAANIVLPVRTGELVRVGWVTSDDPGTAGKVVATILIEKYLDLAALAMLVLITGEELLVLEGKWKIAAAAGFTVALITAAIAGPILWKKMHPWLAARLTGKAAALLAMIDQFVACCLWLRSPKRAALALLMTGLTWVVMVLTNLLCLQALGMTPDLKSSFMVLVLIYVSIAPALMPGNVGPFYFFARLGLSPISPTEQMRTAFAMLLHALVTLTPLVFAGIYLWMSPLSFRRLRQLLKPPAR